MTPNDGKRTSPLAHMSSFNVRDFGHLVGVGCCSDGPGCSEWYRASNCIILRLEWTSDAKSSNARKDNGLWCMLDPHPPFHSPDVNVTNAPTEWERLV